ncbi:MULTISPECIES: metallophosphoesterase family protein [unclassified Sphingomonas]|uniref:metallophosphoesterase family protein n=1 Tax=unclassified Sphingomonas TaxID=196159 RepID=UPI000BCBB110|nr:MAG: hypothetical protein B7Z43_06855 [Sphingomonas sp. 12-62-6]OYX39143.1 MAG: hypothetical protein B7Y98_06345 [Sphingomonas sp. 32-62-10]
MLSKWFGRKTSAVAALEPGKRVYAIGDIHGRADLLDQLIDLIEADDATRGDADIRLIFLGDLIDRGADSARVIEIVGNLLRSSDQVRLIKGNHEEVFVAAAGGCAKSARQLLKMGGYETLESYGITREEADQGTIQDLADLLKQRIPRDHIDVIDRGEEMIRMGDYVFVHAGIRPGVQLDRQVGSDLRWIRQPFLDARRRDRVVVVHGHTPTQDVEFKPDRIGIDTGACYSGKLTALGLEGTERWVLQT